jgi:hypothetical protein
MGFNLAFKGLMHVMNTMESSYDAFDIYMSVHRNIIPNYSQQDATFFIYLFLQTLYMFQAVPPPIIRST